MGDSKRPLKKFIPPTIQEVAERMAEKFREKFPTIRNEAVMLEMAHSWAEEFISHYQRMAISYGRDEHDWRWGKKGERPMKEWKIACGQWFRTNIDDGKHLRKNWERRGSLDQGLVSGDDLRAALSVKRA